MYRYIYLDSPRHVESLYLWVALIANICASVREVIAP